MVKKLSLLVLLSLASNIRVKAAEPLDPVLKQFVPKENVFLPSGTILRGTIMGAVFSFNIAVPIVINLDEPALCPKNNYVVFPRNTRLLATGNVLKSDDRVNMTVYRVILPSPSGKEFEVNGMVLSPDGTAGVKGTKKEYKDARYMSSAASGALSGVGQIIASQASPIAAGAAGGVISSGAADVNAVGTKQVDVSISIPPQQKVTVFLTERLIMDKNEPIAISSQEK